MQRTILALILAFCCATSARAEESSYLFTGNHYLASYHECDHEALCSFEGLKEAMLRSAEASGATVLGYCDYIFPPDGYTLVVLLSESHASIHTYPEYNACYVDLFTCGTKCDAAKFERTLKAYLSPNEVKASYFYR